LINKNAYEIMCPALLVCGGKDHAGSCIRYNKAWHKKPEYQLNGLKELDTTQIQINQIYTSP